MQGERAVYISPSILAANYLNFADEIASIEAAGADFHHIDVMDGHFVPNLTFGPPLVRALKKIAKLPLDVHIMVSNPDVVAQDYVAAGADILVFHVEAAIHANRIATTIKAAGKKAGIAINPGTSLESLWPLVGVIDQINVMSVNPGFAGQKYIAESTERIATIFSYLKSKGLEKKVLIEVDGGIGEDNAAMVIEKGASILVSGNSFFNAKDRAGFVQKIKSISNKKFAPGSR